MKYKQLLAFRTVMLTGSVSSAAERIQLSQPAVSNLIASLEHNCGFLLFERRKGRLIPTPDAHHIYDNITKALSAFEKVSQTSHDIREQKSGSLRIACMPSLSNKFLPDVISEFLVDRDDVTISLQVQPSLKIQRWIAGDLYDIGIAEMPLIHSGIDCDSHTFKCICCLPEGHPLLKHKILTPKVLDNEPFVSLGMDHMTYHQINRAFVEADVNWKVRIKSQLFLPAARLSRKGCGISILDPISIAAIEHLGLKTRPFLPDIIFKIGVLYSSEHPLSSLAEEFSKLLKKRLLKYSNL
jgi:DNA-binding transcriptional LysR family regulator|tara:strand:+ start:277 stop:1167 length:891 start_codon:yes stop_codon:yes gene_type:complete